METNHNNNFKNVLASYALPTDWLKFYVNILLMLWIVTNVAICGSYLLLNKVIIEQFGIINFIVEIIFSLTITIISAITRKKLKLFLLNGYKLNIYLNLLGLFRTFVTSYLNYFYNGSANKSYIIIQTILMAIFIILNLWYFKRRKDLFVNAEDIMSEDKVS